MRRKLAVKPPGRVQPEQPEAEVTDLARHAPHAAASRRWRQPLSATRPGPLPFRNVRRSAGGIRLPQHRLATSAAAGRRRRSVRRHAVRGSFPDWRETALSSVFQTNNKCSARETCANPHCPCAGTQSLNPRFWALRLDAILDDPVAQAMESKCWKVMENAPKRTKGPFGDGADDEYSYRTVQSSQWPCLCTYVYAGIQRHEIYQHGAPTDQPVSRTRAPKAGRSV